MIPNSPLIDVLDSGFSVSNPTVITVYFVPSGGTWIENGTSYTSAGWTQYEIDQALLALEQWSNVANVSFVQTTNQATATFELGNTDLGASGPLGYAFLPTGSLEDGIVVFNYTGTGWDWDTPGAGLEQGGYGFVTLLHEFGHGLGLEHSHSDGGGSASFPGVTSAFNDLGDFDLNQGVYTTMSYNDGWYNGPNGFPSTNNFGFQGTPMALDIAAVQQIYGANTTYNSGNDVYSLPDVNASGTFYSAIWDTGGIDTISYGGSDATIINLNDATLQVEEGGGGYISYADGIDGGFTIAHGVVIENATGGSGSDQLIGNQADNVLSGNAGADLLVSGTGNDTLDGGADADRVITFAGINTLTGGSGNDYLAGGIQADTLMGGAGNDVLQGEQLDGYLGGSDVINGGTGNDIMMGGAGADVFVFATNDGNDLIAGFDGGDVNFGAAGPSATAAYMDFTDEVDLIQLNGFAGVTAGNVGTFITDGINGAVFSAEGTTITVFGVAASDLTADDFIFV